MAEEFIDIVDKSDKVIGKGLRKNVHRSDCWHRGVHVLLLNEKNELLLPLRSKTKDKYPNTYDCSISEHVKLGETFEQAVRRGLKEEFGITAPKLKKLVKFRMAYGKNDNTIATLYECRHLGELVADRSEVESFEFLPPTKVKSLLEKKELMFSPWTKAILKWYFKMPSELEPLE